MKKPVDDMIRSVVGDCKLTELPKHPNDRGNLTVIEGGGNIPFDIERVYYLYDIPAGEERGGHAHRRLHQLIVAASGSFDVILDDGTERKTISLNRPFQGITVVPGIWRELVNFSSGAICLVIASMHYDEADYIRDYGEFLKIKSNE